MRLFSACIVQLGSRQATAQLRFAEFGFIDAARGGAVAAHSCGRSSRRGLVDNSATGLGGTCSSSGGAWGCWRGFIGSSTATPLMMGRGVCVYSMDNNNIVNGCKVIVEQIVGLTGLCKFVHAGVSGLDGCGDMRRGYLFYVCTNLRILVRLISLFDFLSGKYTTGMD